jgi:beta-lactam-binding protein with PASTA domain
VGQSQLAAEINLKRRGLEVGSIATVHVPGATAQLVVAQSPPANAKAVTSPRVDLVVAAQDNQPSYVMPSFVNKPLAEAAAEVEQGKMKLGGKWGEIRRSQVSDRTQKKKEAPGLSGTVVKQFPPAGQKVAEGTEVFFEVSK